jgi:hypothetical protein
MSLRIHLGSSAEESGMLDLIAANPGLTAALVLAGAVLGLLVARLVLPGPKRVRKLEEQLEKAHKEHQAYRSNVTTHFQKTAELVGKMTESYKAVYDHLAYGSQTLAGEYDALTSSVFGPPRIIHDPTVAVGETSVGGAAAAAAPTTASPAADSTEAAAEADAATKAQQRDSLRFGVDDEAAEASAQPDPERDQRLAASGAAERADATAPDAGDDAAGTQVAADTGAAVQEARKPDGPAAH